MHIIRKQLYWPSRNFSNKMQYTHQYKCSRICTSYVCCGMYVVHHVWIIHGLWFSSGVIHTCVSCTRTLGVQHTQKKKKFLTMIMQFDVLLPIWYFCVLIYTAVKLISDLNQLDPLKMDHFNLPPSVFIVPRYNKL